MLSQRAGNQMDSQQSLEEGSYQRRESGHVHGQADGSINGAGPLLHKQPSHSSPNKSVPQIASKLDWIALTSLLGGSVVIVACIGFLAFLWSADENNLSWHWIVSHNHLQTVVTGLAEALKQAITFQVGTVAAATAAIMLESSQTSLGGAASLSLARSTASSTKALLLFRDQIRGKLRKLRWNSITVYTIPLVAAVLAISQVFSIILVSDLDLATIAGNAAVTPALFNFNYTSWVNYTAAQYFPTPYISIPQILNFGTGWNQQTGTFPTFAEYSEPPIHDANIDDTGLTLRAFLPYTSQTVRQNLHSYEGQTLVADTRVTCQPPLFDGLPTVTLPGGQNNLLFKGSVLTRQATPRLFNHTIQRSGDSESAYAFNRGVDLQCSVPTTESESNVTLWRTSLCQLPENMPFAGGLVSEFQVLDGFDETRTSPETDNQYWFNSTLWGIGHLVVNVTIGEGWVWALQKEEHPSYYQIRDNWLDLIYTQGSQGDQVLSLSLCYSSFMTAALPVRIKSSLNRTEPSTTFDLGQSKFTFASARQMYGQDKSKSSSERGILDLVKADSWLVDENAVPPPLPPLDSFMRAYTNMNGPQVFASMDGFQMGESANAAGYAGNLSASLGPPFQSLPQGNISNGMLNPDVFNSALFQEIVQTGGSIAFAIQSLLTFMASNAYYQQLPQFDLGTNVTQTPFITTNVPRRWTGLIVVIVVILAHLCVMTLVLVVFTHTTKFSQIGEKWQVVAQLVSPLTEGILRKATLLDDDHAKNDVVGRERRRHRVRVDYMPDLDRVGLVEETASGSEGGSGEEDGEEDQGTRVVFRRRWKLANCSENADE